MFEMVTLESTYLTNMQSSHHELGPIIVLCCPLSMSATLAGLTISEFTKHQFYIHLYSQALWNTHAKLSIEILHLAHSHKIRQLDPQVELSVFFLGMLSRVAFFNPLLLRKQKGKCHSWNY